MAFCPLQYCILLKISNKTPFLVLLVAGFATKMQTLHFLVNKFLFPFKKKNFLQVKDFLQLLQRKELKWDLLQKRLQRAFSSCILEKVLLHTHNLFYFFSSSDRTEHNGRRYFFLSIADLFPLSLQSFVCHKSAS